MKTDNPEVVSTQVYGKSYENRDITLLKVRKKKKKKLGWPSPHECRVLEHVCLAGRAGIQPLSEADCIILPGRGQGIGYSLLYT